MPKRFTPPTPNKKREITKAAKFVNGVMARNKLSLSETAKRLRINKSICVRLLNKKITYVPPAVSCAMDVAKERSRAAYWQLKPAREWQVDINIVRLRLQDVEREKKFLESLLKG